MIEVASTVLFASDPAATTAFYRALGVPLEAEDHGDGAVHAAAEVGDVHFAVYGASASGSGAPGWREVGCTFVGFYVSSLEATLQALEAVGGRLIAPHQHRDWGCRAVVADPDGRAVEINQRDHCHGQ